MKFLYSGFGLAQLWQLWSHREVNNQIEDTSLPFSFCESVYQINELILFKELLKALKIQKWKREAPILTECLVPSVTDSG